MKHKTTVKRTENSESEKMVRINGTIQASVRDRMEKLRRPYGESESAFIRTAIVNEIIRREKAL